MFRIASEHFAQAGDSCPSIRQIPCRNRKVRIYHSRGIPRKQIRYDAHIFTEEELKAFFASIDACKKSPFSPLRCYVIPVIFRLIYTCGLRASEARLLRTNDINLSTGKIFIRESKGWEARIVFVSDDMLDLLCRYDRIIRDTYPDRTAFFPINLEIITVNLLWMNGSMNSGISFQKRP